MNWLDKPVGMMTCEELLNLLLTMAMGGYDRYTLRGVAQGAGIREEFDREVGRLQPPVITVEKPVYLLSE